MLDMQKPLNQVEKSAAHPDRGRQLLVSLLELRRIGKFLVIGTLGFLTDAGCFMAFSQWGLTIYSARLSSFSVAVCVTWLFNSRWTFHLNKSKSVQKTFLKYLGSQSMGSLVNLAVFFVGVSINQTLRSYPPIAIAIASICAMAFNYIACHVFVFGSHSAKEGHPNQSAKKGGQRNLSRKRSARGLRKKRRR